MPTFLLTALLFACAAFVILRVLEVRSPLAPAAALFLLLVFFVWVGGEEMTPEDAPGFGIYWVSFLIVTVVIVLVITLLSPPRSGLPRPQLRQEAVILFGLVGLFLVLAVVLILLVASGYLF